MSLKCSTCIYRLDLAATVQFNAPKLQSGPFKCFVPHLNGYLNGYLNEGAIASIAF